jgi:glucose/mannose transport system substrate-binding protein
MLPAPIISSIKIKGHYYAAPINIHMPSWLWYSKAVLQKAGVAEPKSVDEFFAALDKLKASGVTPLALGGQPWQEALTFNAMLTFVGGRDLYMKFYGDRDAAAVDSPAFRKVLTSYRKLKDYTDAGAPGRNWNDATSMVITGKAGFQLMGDWAKGEFSAANQTAGKEYGCIAGFGPNSPYMIGGDVFVFPKTKDPETAKAQMLLATVMTSKATQVAFNVKKGSVPIRTDVDASAMDACAQLGLQILKDSTRHLPSSNQLLSPDAVGAVQDVVTKFFNAPSPNVDETVKALQVAVKR